MGLSTKIFIKMPVEDDTTLTSPSITKISNYDSFKNSIDLKLRKEPDEAMAKEDSVIYKG